MRPDITASTKLFGVIGHPVEHSMSPAMHNAAFSALGINGVYLGFNVTNLEDAVRGIRGLNIGGASITIPHKISVMSFLDEIDPLALKIGAVNTIVSRNGRLSGYNTDCLGAVKALQDVTDVKGKHVVIAGAGGAARAIGFGVLDAGGLVTLINHDLEEGAGLSGDLGCDCFPLDGFPGLDCDILVNATPLGMTPNINSSPVLKRDLKPHMTVMDIVYNPIHTQLLKDASGAGCQTIDGTQMFVYQGAAQFELWTETAPPVSVMREVVLSLLGK